MAGDVILREYICRAAWRASFCFAPRPVSCNLTAEGAGIRADAIPADFSISEFYTSDRFPGLGGGFMMTNISWINAVVGKPWVDADGPNSFDCLGDLVVDSYRRIEA